MREISRGGEEHHSPCKQSGGERYGDEGPERATSGVGGVLLEPVGALNRDQPRAQHTVQDNHSLSYIENRVQPREGGRGGCGGGCGVVEVDIWRRARYGSGTNNTGRSRRGRESTGRIKKKKETSGRDNEKETRQK